MNEAEARALLLRFEEAVSGNDLNAFMACVHQDFVEEFPQSGERVRGLANHRALFEHYTYGGDKVDLPTTRVVAAGDQWAMTPTFVLVRVEGSGDTFTSYGRGRYPDGSYGYVVSIVEVRDRRIARRTSFFAPEYETPEWRRPYVELIDRGA
jgi:ketosteroid isomerase-like protein